MQNIHIIEPTLQNETGHCCGYVTSLLESSEKAKVNLELWVGKAAAHLFKDHKKTHPIFYRKWRKLQIFFLYRYLLKHQQIIFIPTAGRLDLIMLNWLARKNCSAKIFLHFHQFKITRKKQVLLKKIATRHPEFHIFAPTAKLIEIFIQAGFKNCKVIPCPTYSREKAPTPTAGSFKKVIYAGAARQDKGLGLVANLVSYLQAIKSTIPIALQISPDHSGKYDEVIQNVLSQLAQSNYSYLTTYKNTLTKNTYQELFERAICLQLYDNQIYADKFSGVTLDALYAGCPIITTDGTWIADTLKRFNAGIVIENTLPITVYNAINTIITRFQFFQNNALVAGKTLREEHDPINTLKAIINN